jgi:hypothetical protein
VVVLEIAANGHLAGAVATRDVPFTPIVCVYAPWCEVVAVRRHLVVLRHHGVSVSHAALLVHGRVGARSDVGKAQRGVRGCARGRRGIVFLRGRVGRVLGLLGRVGEGDVLLVVLLFGAHASWARARVGVGRMRRWLRLVNGVGARRERVLLGVARYLGLGGDHGRRRVC